MIQFHVYVNGEPTKGIFATLSGAQEGYEEEVRAGQQVEIRTVNSPGSVQRWYYDNDIEEWVQR